MATPLTYDMGVSQGRIQPVNATPVRTTASRVSAAEPFNFATAPQTLTVTLNGGAPRGVIFSVADFAVLGAATAEEVAAVLSTGGAAGINNRLPGATMTVTGGGTTVTITTNTPGAAGSVLIAVGGAQPLLGFSVLAAAAGTGGNFLYAMGSDRLPAPDFYLELNDEVAVNQDVDLTGVRYVRANLRGRQPLAMPRQVNIGTAIAPGTVTLQRGGFFATSGLHARRSIGAADAMVTYWANALGAAGTAVRVAHVSIDPTPVLSVAVAGNDITVFLRTVAAVVTSTAAQVAAAVNASAAASALVTASSAVPGALVAVVGAMGALVLSADDLSGVVTSVDFFTEAHVGQTLRVSGSGAGNNADRLIVTVLTPRQAILSSNVVTEGAGFTAVLVGYVWEGAILIDGAVRASIREVRGRDITRTDLAAHTSKLAGVHNVAFRYRLVEEP